MHSGGKKGDHPFRWMCFKLAYTLYWGISVCERSKVGAPLGDLQVKTRGTRPVGLRQVSCMLRISRRLPLPQTLEGLCERDKTRDSSQLLAQLGFLLRRRGFKAAGCARIHRQGLGMLQKLHLGHNRSLPRTVAREAMVRKVREHGGQPCRTATDPCCACLSQRARGFD